MSSDPEITLKKLLIARENAVVTLTEDNEKLLLKNRKLCEDKKGLIRELNSTSHLVFLAQSSGFTLKNSDVSSSGCAAKLSGRLALSGVSLWDIANSFFENEAFHNAEEEGSHNFKKKVHSVEANVLKKVEMIKSDLSIKVKMLSEQKKELENKVSVLSTNMIKLQEENSILEKKCEDLTQQVRRYRIDNNILKSQSITEMSLFEGDNANEQVSNVVSGFSEVTDIDRQFEKTEWLLYELAFSSDQKEKLLNDYKIKVAEQETELAALNRTVIGLRESLDAVSQNLNPETFIAERNRFLQTIEELRQEKSALLFQIKSIRSANAAQADSCFSDSCSSCSENNECLKPEGNAVASTLDIDLGQENLDWTEDSPQPLMAEVYGNEACSKAFDDNVDSSSIQGKEIDENAQIDVEVAKDLQKQFEILKAEKDNLLKQIENLKDLKEANEELNKKLDEQLLEAAQLKAEKDKAVSICENIKEELTKAKYDLKKTVAEYQMKIGKLEEDKKRELAQAERNIEECRVTLKNVEKSLVQEQHTCTSLRSIGIKYKRWYEEAIKKTCSKNTEPKSDSVEKHEGGFNSYPTEMSNKAVGSKVSNYETADVEKSDSDSTGRKRNASEEIEDSSFNGKNGPSLPSKIHPEDSSGQTRCNESSKTLSPLRSKRVKRSAKRHEWEKWQNDDVPSSVNS